MIEEIPGRVPYGVEIDATRHVSDLVLRESQPKPSNVSITYLDLTNT